MGICWNCSSDIKLKKGEKHCNNCGEEIKYKCWSCKNEIDIDEVKEILESKECSWCGFFFCPTCKRCGTTCDRPKWLVECSENKYKYQEVVQYLGNVKKGKYSSLCPRNVPWSYAKTSNRLYLLKMLGHRAKSDEDTIEYKKRYDEIIEQKINDTWTIDDIRSNGRHGVEDRETCNLATCFGIVIHSRIKKKDSESIYSLYKRVEGLPCEHFDDENLVVKSCPKCKMIYNESSIYCVNINCYGMRGKNSGMAQKLKLKISNKKICKLHREKFVQTKEVYTDESI